MSDKEIIENINEKIKELETSEYEYNAVIEYFRDFFNNNSISIDKLTEIDTVNFLEVSFVFMSSRFNNKYLKAVANYLNDIWVKIDNLKLPGEDVGVKLTDSIAIYFTNNMYYFGTTMDYLVRSDKISDAYKYLKEKDYDKLNDLIKNDLDSQMANRFIKIVTRIENTAKNDTESLRSVFKIYRDIPSFSYAFYIISTIICLKKEKMWYNYEMERYENISEKKLKEKEKQKSFVSYIKGRYKEYIDFALVFRNVYQDRYSYFLIESKNFNRKKKKLIKNYTEFKNKFIKEIKSKEITNYQELINLIDDDNIRTEVLKYIYKHNESYYKELSDKYNKLKNNNRINVIALLKENNIKDYDIEKIIHNKYDDIKKIIEMTSRINLNSTVTRKILEESNLETLTFIKSLIDKGILSKELVEENNDIFIDTSKEYLNLINNLKTLEENNYNPLNFSDDILLTNTDLLLKNISVMEKYSLRNLVKGKKNYNFMKYSNLDNIIDVIIETGNEDILEKDITILNEHNINRLYILKLLGIKIKDEEELKNILKSNNFYINDSSIMDYIESSSNYYNNDINLDIDLNSFINTKRSYKIGNIILSKIRVDSMLEKGKSIFESITTNTVLSSDDINYLIENYKIKRIVK